MTFPVIFHPFGLSLHAHMVLEILAYTLGFQTYLMLRKKYSASRVDDESQLWIIAGCLVGAMVGSKVLAWAESFPDYWSRRSDILTWMGGKTIAGGLMGGWLGVEIAKRILRIRHRTGDAYVIPLCIGIAVGRVGCFLSGLEDHTHGIATSLPWGIDFGDGIHRHPTQLYEAIFLLLFAAIYFAKHGKSSSGQGFRVFIAVYMLFRVVVEFIKPTWKPAGLSAIQWASLVTLFIAIFQLYGTRRSTVSSSP